jgi:hypothetical protein
MAALVGQLEIARKPPTAEQAVNLEEEAALAVGRGQADEPAVRGREHGTDGAVDVVGDLGGLVDEEQADAGVAANGLLLERHTDNSAALVQREFLGVRRARLGTARRRPGGRRLTFTAESIALPPASFTHPPETAAGGMR